MTVVPFWSPGSETIAQKFTNHENGNLAQCGFLTVLPAAALYISVGAVSPVYMP